MICLTGTNRELLDSSPYKTLLCESFLKEFDSLISIYVDICLFVISISDWRCIKSIHNNTVTLSACRFVLCCCQLANNIIVYYHHHFYTHYQEAQIYNNIHNNKIYPSLLLELLQFENE